MGILADFFTCAAADAARYPESIGKNDPRFQKVELKGLTELELGTLWAILEGKDFEDARHRLKEMKLEAEEWLYEFPDAYVSLLAGLKGEQIATAGAAWAATEELEWEPSDGQEVLTELAKLAGAARAKKQGLYFWGSL